MKSKFRTTSLGKTRIWNNLVFIAKLLGIKDQNIKIDNLFDGEGTHKEIMGRLDYDAPPCSACKGTDDQIPLPETPKSLIWRQRDAKLLSDSKSVAFAVRTVKKWLSAETSLVQKNHQIATAVKQKIAQYWRLRSKP